MLGIFVCIYTDIRYHQLAIFFIEYLSFDSYCLYVLCLFLFIYFAFWAKGIWCFALFFWMIGVFSYFYGSA